MRKKGFVLLATIVALAIIFGGCKQKGHFLKKLEGGKVLQIAIQTVKDGKLAEFKKASSDLSKLIGEQPAIAINRSFESFYALPEPDKNPVFVNLTEWKIEKENMKSGKKLMKSKEAKELSKLSEIKAFVMAVQTEGKDFDMKNIATKSGQILEIGVRKMHKGKDKEFNEYRKEFVDFLTEFDGVLESYEFEVVAGKDSKRLSVGMTVYENKDAFMKIMEPVMNAEITGKYFSTFDVIASQFSFSSE